MTYKEIEKLTIFELCDLTVPLDEAEAITAATVKGASAGPQSEKPLSRPPVFVSFAARWLKPILLKLRPNQSTASLLNVPLAEVQPIRMSELLLAVAKESPELAGELVVSPHSVAMSLDVFVQDGAEKESSPEKISDLKFLNFLTTQEIDMNLLFCFLLSPAFHAWSYSSATLMHHAMPKFFSRVLYELLPMLGAMSFLMDHVVSSDSEQGKDEALQAVNAQNKELQEKLAIATSGWNEQEKRTAEAESLRLKAVQEASAERLQALRDKTKEISDLQEEIESLRDRLEMLQEENHSLSAQLDVMAESEDLDDVELPEENIAVVGGHENWIRKLRLAHPKWTFVSRIAKQDTFPRKPKCLLMFTNHMGHKEFEIAKSVYKGQGVPILFVTGVNQELLEREIKRLYKQFVLS